MSGVARQVGARVAFAVAAILRNDDRSGQIVRAQGEAGVAHAPGKSPQQIFRVDVLVINLSADFGVVAVLALTGALLDQLVGNRVASFAVRNRKSQAIALRKIMLIRDGKSVAVSPVGKVLQNWGIEVPVAMKSAAAEFQMILARSVANFRRATHRIEAAAPALDSAMPSLGRIFFGR